MSFLNKVIKELDNEFASIVDEGVSAGDCSSFVDTGSYILNALISGSIFGGLPQNKITALAGESSTGKTFFALSIVKNFLDQNPNGEVAYFETESAISKDMMTSRGIRTKNVGLVPVTTVQEFRTQAIKLVDEYMKFKKEDRPPMMFVLDSLGMLSTSKEVQDASDGKETRDMTRAQVIKSIFRILSLKLGQAGIPLIVTNHTYEVVGAYVPTKEMGGGTGLKCLLLASCSCLRRRRRMVRTWWETSSNARQKSLALLKRTPRLRRGYSMTSEVLTSTRITGTG